MVRLTSVLTASEKRIRRRGIPFGAAPNHSEIPATPADTAMIYPNPAKDVETTEYPYAELFRDFAAALCRPNTVLVSYGYGFGDDHINRVVTDMLTIPSTHLVIFAYAGDERLTRSWNAVGGKLRSRFLSVRISLISRAWLSTTCRSLRLITLRPG